MQILLGIMNSGINNPSNLKTGADLLLKGGSLLDIPCSNCGGVQIRYKTKITCINCGKETPEIKDHVDTNSLNLHYKKNEAHENQLNSNIAIAGFDKIIIQKISNLFDSLKDDNDLLNQSTKLELIIKYIEILEKIPKILKT
ncbi:MAG TPA: Sjogren's syndrome/scleroderma autoantigen 1 family protein [Nitrososphaeraceae archaeon]|nr:Sjogren's syndrome/scleroderma autoantigen 1 family protein [Nitrososphaeraceae archaeon]